MSDNPQIRINVKKIENRVTVHYYYRDYYCELLTPETVKLIGNTKSKTTKNQNGENLPHLEIT